MPAPIRRKTLGDLLGSWPFSDVPDGPGPQLLPRALQSSATILGTRSAPSGGYLVDTLSMFIWVDGTQRQVNFNDGGPYTLAAVITEINGAAGMPANVARNANGFLQLVSPTSGTGSSLRLESIPGAEAVFIELGLFSETEAFGGEIFQAQHTDPTRQVALPGQAGMQLGENFSSDVINRIAFSLGANQDRLSAIVDERLLAVQASESYAGSGAAGVQLNASNPEGVYLGLQASPSVDQLKDVLVVLDSKGHEFVREQEIAFLGTQADLAFTYDADSGETRVNSTLLNFAGVTLTDPFFLIATNLVGASALNNVPLRIIRVIDADNVAVHSVDPNTGVFIQITESGRSGRVSRVYAAACEVEGFYADVGLTIPINPTTLIARASGAGSVTRIDKNNRAICGGGGIDFTLEVQPGDIATWTGAGSNNPHTNNGVYRVRRVIDAKTLELLDEDFGPVFLNPNVGGGFGTLTVTSNGLFAQEPYVKFVPTTLGALQAGTGCIPQTGDSFTIAYMVGKTMRDAVEADPTILSGGGIRYEQEATSDVAKTLMRMLGPSVDSFDEILFGTKEMLNFDFLSREHHAHSGRHSTVRQDTIDQYPPSAANTMNTTFRGAAGGGAGGVWSFRDATDIARAGFNDEGKFKLSGVGAPSNADVFNVSPFFPFTRPLLTLEATDAHILFRTDTGTSRVIFDNRNPVASGTLATLQTSQSDSSGITFSFDDGVLVANRHTYQMGIVKANDDPFSAWSLGIASDNGGLNLSHQLLMNIEGQFLFHGHNNVAIPAGVGVVMRTRGVSEPEALRIQGAANSNDETLAISFQPNQSDLIYSFIEIDKDVDWFMNYVITDEGLAASGGGDGAAHRFLVGDSATDAERFRIDEFGVVLYQQDFVSASTGLFDRQIRWWFDDPEDLAAAITVSKEAGVSGVFTLRMFTEGGAVSGLYVRKDGTVGVGISTVSTSGIHVDITALGGQVGAILQSNVNQSVLRFFNNSVSSAGVVGIGADGDDLVFRADSGDRAKLTSVGLSLLHTAAPEAGIDFGQFAFGNGFMVADHNTNGIIHSPPGSPANLSSYRRAIRFRPLGSLAAEVGGKARLQVHLNRYDAGDGATGDTWTGMDLPGFLIGSNVGQSTTVADDEWVRDVTTKSVMALLMGTEENFPYSRFAFVFDDAAAGTINYATGLRKIQAEYTGLLLQLAFENYATKDIGPTNTSWSTSGVGVRTTAGPAQICKAWGWIQNDTTAAPLRDGVNFFAAAAGAVVTVAFTTTCPETKYNVVTGARGPGTDSFAVRVSAKSATGFSLEMQDIVSGVKKSFNAGSAGDAEIYFAVFVRA